MKLAAALLASGFRITLRVSGMTWVGLALFVSQLDQVPPRMPVLLMWPVRWITAMVLAMSS